MKKDKEVLKEELKAFTLPQKKSEPKESIGDYTMLIFGEKKIGKTTLCSKFPDALFLMTEPGGEGLSIFQMKIDHWRKFVKAVDLLEKDKKYKTVIVDTVDNLYELCFDYMCKEKLLIEHPQDENDFGRSWKVIKKEFTDQLSRLMFLNKGFIALSHAQERETTTLSGDKFDRLIPTMGRAANEYLTGVIDIWAYYGYEDRKRFLVIEGDDYIGAGHRLEGRFLTPEKEKVVRIPMGKNSEESYNNFIKAFNNKQTTTGGKDEVIVSEKRTFKRK